MLDLDALLEGMGLAAHLHCFIHTYDNNYVFPYIINLELNSMVNLHGLIITFVVEPFIVIALLLLLPHFILLVGFFVVDFYTLA